MRTTQLDHRGLPVTASVGGGATGANAASSRHHGDRRLTLTLNEAASRCIAVVHGPEYGPYSHMVWRCNRPAKAVVTMHRMGDTDIKGAACGIHARVARTTGRVTVA